MAVANPPTRLIPANTVVDSYLIHGDSLGASGPSGATLTASWTFDEPILGVFMGRDNLVITDALVGLTGTPGLTYERTSIQRGLEFGSNDVVRVTGPNTIEVTFDFNAMDEIRVLTGTIAPDCVPDDPPNALAVRTAPGNLRLDGLPATGQPTFQSNTCLFAFAEGKDVDPRPEPQPDRPARHQHGRGQPADEAHPGRHGGRLVPHPRRLARCQRHRRRHPDGRAGRSTSRSWACSWAVTTWSSPTPWSGSPARPV